MTKRELPTVVNIEAMVVRPMYVVEMIKSVFLMRCDHNFIARTRTTASWKSEEAITRVDKATNTQNRLHYRVSNKRKEMRLSLCVI